MDTHPSSPPNSHNSHKMTKKPTIGAIHLIRAYQGLQNQVEVVAQLQLQLLQLLQQQQQLTLLPTTSDTYDVVERYLLQEKQLTNYQEFKSWFDKVGPTIISTVVYNSTGEKLTYKQINQIAKQCLTTTMEVKNG